MSKPRKIGIFALLAVAIWCSVTTAFASDESIMGFQVILAEDEKADVFLTSIDFEFVDQHISNYPIFCFDVNEHGAYALGFNASKKLVNVYDTDGVFLYGCRFSCNGTYSIGISENNGLFIYFVRSDVIVNVDMASKSVVLWEIPLTAQNLSQISSTLDVTEKSVDGATYYLDSDLLSGLFGYSKLIAKNDYGKRTVLYDVSADQNALIIGGSVIVLVVSLLIIKKLVSQKKQQKR